MKILFTDTFSYLFGSESVSNPKSIIRASHGCRFEFLVVRDISAGLLGSSCTWNILDLSHVSLL
ncbi:hypothetical protein [Methylacidiphilum caldifontis]|uniref:hypothetical protein n=1 Tax=Methylacidiphilum caldifontis TaxID=2795386 RepID=UPI001068F9FC|nr:hypothetical protein [Methylacidiphilum caldifontis]